MYRYILLLLLAGAVAGCADMATPPTTTTAATAVSRGDSCGSTLLWIDTDIVIDPENVSADPDDGIALAMLQRCPEVVGISTISGNASSDIVWKTATQLDAHTVFRGRPGNGCGNPAVVGMATALEQGSMTIIALGPLTNVAMLIQCRPDLIENIEEVVAIGGRSEGVEFRLGEGGPLGFRPMKDLNYELDPEAFELVLDSLPVRLFGFEAGEKVRLSYSDLAPILDSDGVLGQPLIDAVRNWSATLRLVGGGGTIPAFDPVAVVGALDRNATLFDCVPGEAAQVASNLVFTPEVGSAGDTSFCTPIDPPKVKGAILNALRR